MAAAERRRRVAVAAVLLVVAAAVTLLPATPAAAFAGCGNDVSDPYGVGHPRANLTTHCVDYGDTVTFLVRTEQMSNPHVDFPGILALDVIFDDPEFPAYWIAADVRAGRLTARAWHWPGQEPGDDVESQVVCNINLRYAEGWFVLGPFAPACIGSRPSSDDLYYSIHSQYSPSGREDFADASYDYSPQQYPNQWRVPRYQTAPFLRIAGGNRIETAVKVSRTRWGNPTGARSVYLVQQDQIALSIAAGSVADGPILLVPGCGAVPAVVRDEIDRINPQRVVVLGGQDAICEQQFADAAADRTGIRLAGSDEIGTAALLARDTFPGASELYLARADNPVDAVAGGALRDGPTLLVPQCGPVPQTVLDTVVELDPASVLALGGPAAICEQVLVDVAQGRTGGRIYGETRIETAIAIAQYVYPNGNPGGLVYFARADNVVDAAVAGILEGGPTLLIPSCAPAPFEVGSEVNFRLGPGTRVVLGGQVAVCDFSVNWLSP
jgi:hypothetical protein